jgi:D-glycero-alpha-D-manno-heptose-7-phosphate kinase
VRIESRDTLQKVEAAHVGELMGEGGLSLVAYILHALGIATGVKVVTHSRVPAGSGLGGSSALAVAVAAAAARFAGRELDAESLWPIVRDAEAQCIRVPTGVQDYHAAIHGSVLGVHLQAGTVRVERLAVDPAAVEECLILVDAGATRFSGINNWEVFKGQIDGDARVREALGAIARVAVEVRQALLDGRYADVAPLLAREWEARKRLAPAVTTPEVDRIAAAALAAGGAAKVCGAGGGGMVAVWAPPGPRGKGDRERVVESLTGAGFRPVPFRVDLRGLEVG